MIVNDTPCFQLTRTLRTHKRERLKNKVCRINSNGFQLGKTLYFPANYPYNKLARLVSRSETHAFVAKRSSSAVPSVEIWKWTLLGYLYESHERVSWSTFLIVWLIPSKSEMRLKSLDNGHYSISIVYQSQILAVRYYL